MQVFVCLVLIICGALAGTLDRAQTHSSHCNKSCRHQFDPVCGSDGHTYTNLCLLDEAACIYKEKGMNLTVRNHGICQADQFAHIDPKSCDLVCDEELKKICGSDGKIYDNECLFKRAECEAARTKNSLFIVSYADTCPPPQIPNCERYRFDTSDLAVEGAGSITPHCSTVHRYLCASDGSTYANECQLCYFMDRQNVNLTIVYNQPCHHLGIPTNSFSSWLNHLLHPETGDPLAG